MRKNIFLSIILLASGAILRLSSSAIAWPQSYSYSGPREATQWAIREVALNDIAMGLFYIGGAILVGLLLMKQWKRGAEL